MPFNARDFVPGARNNVGRESGRVSGIGLAAVPFNVLWLKNHPNEIEAFNDYNVIQSARVDRQYALDARADFGAP